MINSSCTLLVVRVQRLLITTLPYSELKCGFAIVLDTHILQVASVLVPFLPVSSVRNCKLLVCLRWNWYQGERLRYPAQSVLFSGHYMTPRVSVVHRYAYIPTRCPAVEMNIAVGPGHLYPLWHVVRHAHKGLYFFAFYSHGTNPSAYVPHMPPFRSFCNGGSSI